jgi:N-glycosylase/DNA lyase
MRTPGALRNHPELASADIQIRPHGGLDLEATLYSGQAFRWTRLDDGWHAGFIANRPATIRRMGAALTVRGPQTPGQIQHYFRLDGSHDEFLRAVPRDAALTAALARFPGLRLLRQDPWEMLVSFVISQNSNEAKIRKSIEAMCRLAGRPLDRAGATFAFPTPTELARLSLAQLRSTGMGYRARYVQGVAGEVESGALDPYKLASLPYSEAFDQLMQVDGIGAKVADCVLLYGCDHQAAFPSDVWVRRFLRETYLRRAKNPSHEKIRDFAWRHFGPHAGYAQHYLFHYRRGVGALDSKRS